MQSSFFSKLEDFTGKPPSPRKDHSMVLINDCLYIFGGCYEDRTTSLCFGDLYEFNLFTKEWKAISTKDDVYPGII